MDFATVGNTGNNGAGDVVPTVRMTIDTIGNVGIGTITPQDKLSLNGNIQVAKNAVQPYACDAAHDAVLAITSDGTTACTW